MVTVTPTVGVAVLSQILFDMTVAKNLAGNLLPITVIDDVTVDVLPNEQYEFLLSTKDVAFGYGVSSYNIRQHKLEHSSELIEGKHYLSGVSIPHAATPGASKGVMWTKAGIIRLGFFIRSERAKLFRDWAENLILNVTECKAVALPAKRRHNRLTPERVLDIMADVVQIENSELRTRIAAKLMGGGQPW